LRDTAWIEGWQYDSQRCAGSRRVHLWSIRFAWILKISLTNWIISHYTTRTFLWQPPQVLIQNRKR
jgi:hypothetical protein